MHISSDFSRNDPQDRDPVSGLDQLTGQRQTTVRIENHAGRHSWTGRTSGQQRVIGEDSSDPRDDRVHPPAELMAHRA